MPERPPVSFGVVDTGECNDAETTGIEDEFRRKLAGLRRLPAHQRAPALRAARDARTLALRMLRQRRKQTRDERRFLSRLSQPAPK